MHATTNTLAQSFRGRRVPSILGVTLLLGQLSALAAPAPESSALARPTVPVTTLSFSSGSEAELPWQEGSSPSSPLVGKGVGIVFSPDLVPKENRAFYEALGFAYFESARWTEVLQQIRRYQNENHDSRIRYLIVESHGANGNGLKIQQSKEPFATRSYIALGALQEAAEKLGIRTVIISACNAGRLFRPEIYRTIDRNPGDPLFLPATAGILDAGNSFRPDRSSTQVVRRKQSNLETLVEGSFGELPAWLSERLRDEGHKRGKFVVSTMLAQLVLGDRTLQLTGEGFETEKSRANLTPKESERLFKRFLGFLRSTPAPSAETVAAR